MLANFFLFLLRITNPRSLAFPFLGMYLILFPINIPSAWSQIPQDILKPADEFDSLQYQARLGETNLAFAEFSGSQETDDPLQDFFTYLIDPINWDLSESVEPRTIYRTHTGIQTRQRILRGTSSLRFGLKTMIEDTYVQSLPRSVVSQPNSEQQQNLIDTVFAPYLLVKSQPISWIRLFGNLQLNVLSFDLQHVCPKTCSLEPKGQGNSTVQSFKAGVLFGPWLKTQFFINLGKGFYRFDEREPIGSTAEQQINQTRFLELGVLTNPEDQIEIRGSLWATRSDTDFAYNLEDEEFVSRGPSQRHGLNLDGKIEFSNKTTLTGGITISRSTFRQTQQPIPFTPQLAGRAALYKDWNPNWSTTLQWQYIGKRRTDNQLFPSFQTLDIFLQYQYPMPLEKGHLRASLGILNVGNHRSPFSLFHFDPGLATDPTAASDLNHFPGQPRTVVSGISWLF